MAFTIGGTDLVGLGKDTYREFRDDDVSGLAAELTYRIFLALFPFLIFLTALGGFLANVLDIANPADRFLDLFGDRLPSDAESVIRTQVQNVVGGQNVGLLSVGIVGALWAASGGASAVIKALNRAYDIPDSRPFWKQKLLALGLVLAGTVGFIGSIVLLVATRVFGSDLAEAVGQGATFEAILRWGTWPLLLLMALGATAFIYWAAPNVGLPFRWISAGATFFVFAWLAATIGFSFYVANFGAYNATYGALGGVVILLFWIYISNVVLLLGAELNAVLDERREGPTLDERRKKAAEALQAKQNKQPRNPEAAAAAGAVSRSDGGDADGRPTYPPPRMDRPAGDGAAAPARGTTTGALLAFIGGAALAALAVRRFAR